MRHDINRRHHNTVSTHPALVAAFTCSCKLLLALEALMMVPVKRGFFSCLSYLLLSCCPADVGADEEVGGDVLAQPSLQPDALPHDHPHRPLLWHHVPPQGPPPCLRYALSFCPQPWAAIEQGHLPSFGRCIVLCPLWVAMCKEASARVAAPDCSTRNCEQHCLETTLPKHFCLALSLDGPAAASRRVFLQQWLCPALCLALLQLYILPLQMALVLNSPSCATC